MVLNHKNNLINQAFLDGVISKKDKDKYMTHKKKHTISHLLNMINAQAQGKSFNDAHLEAKGIDTMTGSKKKKYEVHKNKANTYLRKHQFRQSNKNL